MAIDNIGSPRGPLKVAFVIDTVACDTAGTQRQLLEMIRRLDRSRFEPHLICLWESPWMRDNTLPCPVEILEYRGFLKQNLLIVLRRLARFFDNERIDIAQTFFEESIFVTWMASALAKRSPILLSSRRDIGLGKSNQPWYHALFRLALPIVNRSFAGIVANSEQVRQFVARREKTPITKIKVHLNGVTFPDLEKTEPIPRVLSDHPEELWIGLVGSLTPVKRHDLLIRAFAKIVECDAVPRTRLLFLGEGPERMRLEALTSSSGVAHLVHFEGAVSDVGPYLRHIHIGVLCSDREGLSNAILEYMAYGLPIVATRVGGNVELVAEDNGTLIAADDANELASALQTLLKDSERRTRLGRHSREKALAMFSWDKAMSDLQHFYQTVAAVRPTNTGGR